MYRSATALLLILCAISMHGVADEREPRTNVEQVAKVEIDVTTIRTTKELPGLLYIVPWQEAEIAANTEQRKIVIHDLFGDFFSPWFRRRLPIPPRPWGKNKPYDSRVRRNHGKTSKFFPTSALRKTCNRSSSISRE